MYGKYTVWSMEQLETMISCPVAYGGTVLRGGAFQAQRYMQQYRWKELPID
jgi:hypothetical protein